MLGLLGGSVGHRGQHRTDSCQWCRGVASLPPHAPLLGYKAFFFLSSHSLSCWSDNSWSSGERGSGQSCQRWPSFWQLKHSVQPYVR